MTLCETCKTEVPGPADGIVPLAGRRFPHHPKMTDQEIKEHRQEIPQNSLYGTEKFPL